MNSSPHVQLGPVEGGQDDRVVDVAVQRLLLDWGRGEADLVVHPPAVVRAGVPLAAAGCRRPLAGSPGRRPSLPVEEGGACGDHHVLGQAGRQPGLWRKEKIDMGKNMDAMYYLVACVNKPKMISHI